MAIAFDASSSKGYANSASYSWSHTVGAGSDRILILSLSGTYNGTDYVTGGTVTYGGVSMTQLSAQHFSPSNNCRALYVYYLIAPATGTANIVVTPTSSQELGAAAASYSGVKQTGFPDAHEGSNNGTSSSGTNDFTLSSTVADNCWTVLSVVNEGTNAVSQVGTTAFRDFEDTYKLVSLFDSNGAKTPAGSVTLQVSFSGIVGRHYRIFSLEPSAASAPAFVPQVIMVL